MMGAWPPIVPDMERAKTIIIIIILSESKEQILGAK